MDRESVLYEYEMILLGKKKSYSYSFSGTEKECREAFGYIWNYVITHLLKLQPDQAPLYLTKNFNLFFDKNSILLFCTKHMYCYCIICFFFFIKYIFHSSLYPFSCTTIKLALFPAVLLSLSSS